MHRNGCVRVQVTASFLHRVLDRLIHLRCMAGLYVSARRFPRLNFQKLWPQLLITAERIHHDSISRGRLGMMRSSIVLLKNRMMNNSSGHVQIMEASDRGVKQAFFKNEMLE